MALIISIETATSVCSVALHQEGKLLAIREIDSDKSHSELLLKYIDEVLAETGQTKQTLAAIAVSEGPGSYTGLRIGLSTAKGLCFALGAPLIAVNTLDAMALLVSTSDNAIICPMIDARRMEVYTALYDSVYNRLIPPQALVIDDSSFSSYLKDRKIVFFGNGASKCVHMLNSENAQFVDQLKPSASTLGVIAFQKFQKASFEDVAYFEPNYVKEFYSPAPKKNQLLQHLVSGS